jgi:glycosyltransferase involved in cell wall biosynthesis
LEKGLPCILVNVTAAVEGGALSILNQFINGALENTEKFNIYVFTSISLPAYDNSGVHIINVNKKSNIKRLEWDYWGMRKWIKEHNISPSLLISFQNTGINYDRKVPQLIYYHQPAPFEKINWSFFHKEERIFWFYKWIYPFFTKVTLTSKTYFVVQTKWIMEGVMKKFAVKKDKIKIIRPDFVQPDQAIVPIKNAPSPDQFTIFYPALPFVHKNHIEIVDALHLLVQSGRLPDNSNIKIIFTCDFDKSKPFVNRIIALRLEDYFIFTGKITYSEVISYYKIVDLVVFPSVMETFGLPLIEAASFGLKIIASDLNYAREVLADYGGVQFEKVKSSKDWAAALEYSYKEKKLFIPLRIEQQDGWKEFFKFVTTIINEN